MRECKGVIIKMQDRKLIIFDMDGTLFRTETVDVEAFNNALELSGYGKRSEKEILQLIGLKLDEICKSLLDITEEKIIQKFKSDVIHFEEEAILKWGELYPGTLNMLKTLRKYRFTMCICSNGNEEYITAIANKFNLHLIFDDICFEKRGISKCKAVEILKEKYQVHSFIMVGDRSNDIEAGKINNGISIGVTYGFGGDEVEEADFKVESIEELEKTILNIYENSL